MRKIAMTSVLIASLLTAGCAAQSANQPPATPPAQTDPTPTNPTPNDPSTTPVVNPTENPDPEAQTEPEPQPEPEPEPPKVQREMPSPVRGLHLSGWYAGSPDLVWPLLDWAKAAGINTIVLDLKAEDGYISWESNIPLAQEIGANMAKIKDLPQFIADAHERGFWVAGRIVTMNDQWLYKARPEWGVPGFDGGAYSFMDPKNENVWQYNIDVAKEAVAAGIDEIQWDYIRYSEHLRDGYNGDTTAEYRTTHINNFLKRSMEELKPLGVVVGADLFGLTTSVAEGDDMQIGQDYRMAAEIVDYVAPMAYPSHYDPYTYGIPDPNSAPYETVKQSMSKAIERTQGLPLEKHRPWIQAFSMGVDYGPAEVMAQVQALKELGIESFLLWDPANKYDRLDLSFE